MFEEPKTARPQAVVWFEILSLGSLAVGIVLSAMDWSIATQTASPAFVLGTQAGVVLVVGTLTLAVSRARSRKAMWILVVLTVGGAVLAAPEIIRAQWSVAASVSVIQLATELVGLALLFTPASRQWLKAK